MNPMLIALALVTAGWTLGPAPQDPKPAPGQEAKAEELYQKGMKRLDEAKVLHIQCTCTPEGARAADALEFDAKVLGRALLWFSAKGARHGMEFELRSDGRRMVGSTGGDRKDVELAAEEVNALVRRSAGQSMVALILMMEMGRRPGGRGRDVPEIPAITVSDLKVDGSEKVGAVEATILSYKIKSGIPDVPEFAVRSWIDPATALPVKRTLGIQGMSILEDLKVLSFDEKLTEEDFAFHNAKTLAKGRELQVQRSVELFARVTGRPPRTLEDLKRRPAGLDADVFWPEGGFWPGDAPPKDVPYSVSGETAKVGETEVKAPDGRFLVAPSDRVKALFTARVHLALLAAAVEAYRETYLELPGKRAGLSRKPDWAAVWPAGGFVPEGAFPRDPWGKDYRIVTDENAVSVMVRDSKERLIKTKELTPEELKGLATGETPRLTAAELEQVEKLLKDLGNEDLQVREDAGTALIRCGARIAVLLQSRLQGEKDPQVSGDLRAILKRLVGSRQVGWRREFGQLSIQVGSGARQSPLGPSGTAERIASMCMRILPTAEADFRANDRDNNLQNDFWVRDISGLYGLVPDGGAAKPENCIKLIESSLAIADATPERGHYPDGLLEEGAEPTPKGGYLFRMLAKDETGAAYDLDGKGHNFGKFGAVAYPADYGVEGQRTFIVNEDATIWAKDLAGEAIDQFPADPAAEGWTHVD